VVDVKNAKPPKYVIINDTDAPEPKMVCQWMPDVGYCYLDRTNGKRRHDGMIGSEAVSIEAFGWTWSEEKDNGELLVKFMRTNKSTATYPDGVPRDWQHHADSFEFKTLKSKQISKPTNAQFVR
jgi:hypothetical protein